MKVNPGVKEWKQAGWSGAFISKEENGDNGVDGCDDGERDKRGDFE